MAKRVLTTAKEKENRDIVKKTAGRYKWAKQCKKDERGIVEILCICGKSGY